MRIIKPVKRGKSAKQEDASGVKGRYEVVDAQQVLNESRSEKSLKGRSKAKIKTVSKRHDRFATKTRKSSAPNSDLSQINKDNQFSMFEPPSESNPDFDSSVESQAQQQEALSPTKKEYNRIMGSGVRLLAMREHSVKEILEKLSKKTDSIDIVNAVVDELLEKRYLSNERFTESYIRARSNKGFGPIKIRAELKSKGITNSLIAEHLELGSPIWIDRANSQYQKKYGDSGVSDYNTWTKRARFMQSRGFTMEHIQVALPEIEFN